MRTKTYISIFNILLVITLTLFFFFSLFLQAEKNNEYILEQIQNCSNDCLKYNATYTRHYINPLECWCKRGLDPLRIY